jgi:hypothetical protein
MKRRGFRTLLIGIAGGVLAMSPGAGALASEKTNVKADELTGYQEAPVALSVTGSGTFTAEIDEAASTITFEVAYTGLSGTPLFAHIHFGNRSTVGGVSAFFCGGGGKPACPVGDSAVVTGVITPADIVGPTGQGIAPGEFAELVKAIRAGMTYANVHTALFPSGEIRGQINDRDQRQPQ